MSGGIKEVHINLFTSYAVRLKYISNNLKLKGSKVLDLGCGGGLLCEAMTDSGADVVGIDASLKTIEIAKKHANEKILKLIIFILILSHLITKRNLMRDML